MTFVRQSDEWIYIGDDKTPVLVSNGSRIRFGVPVDINNSEIIDGDDLTTFSGVIAADIQAAIDNLIGTAPALLDTLEELSAALGDDADFSTTVISMITTNSGAIVSHKSSADHDGRYHTESEITTISGDIVAQIPTDYISESEMTTISGDIVAQIAGYSGTIPTVSGSMVVANGLITSYTSV